MTMSAVFGTELDELGVWRPRGDGDALRESAAAWTDTADHLEDIGAALETSARSVADHHRGEAATRFATLWSKWTGSRGHVPVTVADCRRVAAALTDFATHVDIADRAILRVAEQALEASNVHCLTLLDEVWRAWLGDQCEQARVQLCSRANEAAAHLGTAHPDIVAEPVEPSATDPAVTESASLAWPGPSSPTDLTHLAITAVDFGAGPGDLMLPEIPVGPLAPEVADPPITRPVGQPLDPFGSTTPTGCPPVGVPPGWAQPGWQGPPTGWPGSYPSWPTTPAAVPPPPSSQPWEPEPFEPFARFAPTTRSDPESEPLPPPEPWEPYEPLPPTTFDPISAWVPEDRPPVPAAPWAPEERSFDRLPPPATPVQDAGTRLDLPTETAIVPPPIAITVDPPGSSGAVAGVAAAGAVGAAGAAAASGGSRAPFFPFMPMGGGMGGGGGDESSEPKRRIPRRHRSG